MSVAERRLQPPSREIASLHDGNRDPSLVRLLALAADRIAIEGVNVEIDGGRFPAKGSVGEALVVEADIFGDGHDVLAAALLYRRADGEWAETPMLLVENDRWRGSFIPDHVGFWQVTLVAWRDLFASWSKDILKKLAAGQTVPLEIEEGRLLVEAAAQNGTDPKAAKRVLEELGRATSQKEQLTILLSDETLEHMRQASPRTNLSRYRNTIDIWVDRPEAVFSAWYELFPRSQTDDPRRHGTFDDVIERLPYVRALGFDVLYFPPIHPIGKTNRKGRNNSLTAKADDPGSPYAIGSSEGGHDTIHPQLGTFADFARLVAAARENGMEVALDFAIQCSPDHPWIVEHPQWFDWRPDGTIKFAENPPKKYEDIVNVHFYREALPDVWFALRDVVLFWVEHGIRIFRVDNPHTKPLPFWEWLIGEVRAREPNVIFLSEAFTRPKLMLRLAKVGFTQSYTYFTWRNSKAELVEYMTQLTDEPSLSVMRPNFFANTPDINPLFLQHGGRAAFRLRLILAATLAGNYGIYNGFEICEAAAVPGKEEYLNSEKYEIKVWDLDRPGHIRDDIALINRLRKEHPALRRFASLQFYNAWNDNILYYGKSDAKSGSFLLFHVCLDPHVPQEAFFEVPLWEFGLPDEASIEVQDLVHGNRFTWHGKVHHIRLDPHDRPYAIWRLFPPGVPR